MHPSKTACDLSDAVASEVGSRFNPSAKSYDYYEITQ